MQLPGLEELSGLFREHAGNARDAFIAQTERIVANLEAIVDILDVDDPGHVRYPTKRVDGGDGTAEVLRVRPGGKGHIEHVAAYGPAAGRIELYIDNPGDPGNIIAVLVLDAAGKYAQPFSVPLPIAQNRSVSAVGSSMAGAQWGVRVTAAIEYGEDK